ncbi:MAG: hypothetical protein ACFE89_05045 [Candidatus Hodarchaeota archaeon]
MNMSAKQKEKVQTVIRFVITVFSGAIMITFANFTVLTGILRADSFVIAMLLIGILVGLYSTEIHYAVLGGLMSIFLGFVIFWAVITIPVMIFATWELYDVLVIAGIMLIVRVVMLQLLGLMAGTVIGRWFGPAWYEPETPKHELKVPLPNQVKNAEE